MCTQFDLCLLFEITAEIESLICGLSFSVFVVTIVLGTWMVTRLYTNLFANLSVFFQKHNTLNSLS